MENRIKLEEKREKKQERGNETSVKRTRKKSWKPKRILNIRQSSNELGKGKVGLTNSAQGATSCHLRLC